MKKTVVEYEVQLQTIGWVDEHVGKLPPLKGRELREHVGKKVIQFIAEMHGEPALVVRSIKRKRI